MNKKILRVALAATLGLGAIGYNHASNKADETIKEYVLDRQIPPMGWTNNLPGKSDATVDLFLDNIEQVYEDTIESQTYGTCLLYNFCKRTCS